MNEERLQSAQHAMIRSVLRIGGPIVIVVALAFMGVGIGSFFSSFGTFEPPRYFWCVFVGMPLLFVGLVMCKLGYLGDVIRYIASESAPVAKDAVNYMGENTQPGVRAVSKAVAEGVIEAQSERNPGPGDPR